jgi:hypothetical protein
MNDRRQQSPFKVFITSIDLVIARKGLLHAVKGTDYFISPRGVFGQLPLSEKCEF